ncbi:MAG: glycosyltransferase family 4 protein [Methanobacterium sp.]
MNSKLNICLIEPVFHKAFISPSSNLEKILFSLSNNFYKIKGVSSDLNIRNDNYNEYIIIHKATNNGFLRILRYIFLQLKMSFKLISLQKEIDICIFFNGSTFILPMITSKLLRKKVLWLLPSSLKKMSYYNDNSFSFFLNIMQDLGYNIVDNIILYSPNLINEWELEKYNDKISSLHRHFLNFNKFRITKKYDQREDIIGYIGRLEKEKGICNFVKSIKHIIKDNNNLKVLIIGDGSLKDRIILYIQTYNLQNHVELINWVEHEELPKYLNQLKLLIIPSYTEGLPNTMLEAMACGTPILTNSVGAIPDYIINEKTGFLMNNNSEFYIKDNIIKSLEYPKIDEIIENANKIANTEFSYNNVVKKWRNFLKKI